MTYISFWYFQFARNLFKKKYFNTIYIYIYIEGKFFDTNFLNVHSMYRNKTKNKFKIELKYPITYMYS